MAIFSLTQSYWSTKRQHTKRCMPHLTLVLLRPMRNVTSLDSQTRQTAQCVCVYICIYNMYCTHFTGNTSAVHSHISITCSNSMRIFLGWGQITEAFKLCRELGDNQQESYTLASWVETAVCCGLTLWEGGGQCGKGWTSPELWGDTALGLYMET